MTLLLACAVLASVPGTLTLDPRLDWYTLETEHFAIHFPARGRPGETDLELPNRIASIAEELYGRMTARTGSTPRGRTQVVVADFFDYANAWATPIPDNTITIIPTQPAGSRTHYDDWLRTLFAHEYAHILHTDMVRGFPAALRRIFGRVVVFNALQPTWLLEGCAQLYETEMAGLGRLNGTEYDMMLRAAADRDRLLPIDRCANTGLQRYPGGNAPYLFGGMFIRELDAGPAGSRRTWDRYLVDRSAGLPWFDNRFARRTFGRSFPGLWYRWRETARAEARAAGSERRSPSTAPLRPLTDEGFNTSSPCWSGSGSQVFYVSRTGTELTSVRAVDSSGATTIRLYEGSVTGNLALSSDRTTLAFGEYSVQENYNIFTDITALNLLTGDARRLTQGQRARDPDFAPDGSTLVFVAHHSGRTDLMLLDLATGRSRPLLEGGDYRGFSSPRFSPSGRFVAVCVNRAGGCSDIVLLDTRTGWQFPVTDDRAVDISPCWSRTGRYLYFVSDRSGVFNIYAYAMGRDKIYRCTDVHYGAFEPAVSPDNRTLALISYSADGNDVALCPIDPETWTDAETFDDTLPNPVRDAITLSPTLYYYNPLPTVIPRLWAPYLNVGSTWEAGAFTFGWDALQFHRYFAAAGYRFSNTPFLACHYTWSRWWPALKLDLNVDLDRQSVTGGVDFPFRATRRTTWLDLGATGAHDSAFTSRFAASILTTTAMQYRFGVAPATGGVVGVHTDFESRSLGSGRTRLRVLHQISRYLPLPAHGSLKARLVFGVSLGDASADSAWQLSPGPNLLSVRGFGTASPAARTAATLGLQYRVPLSWVERGVGTAPVFLGNVNAAPFLDWGFTSGSLFPDAAGLAGSRLGLGLELRADLILFHLVPASVTAGYGIGLLPALDSHLYFSVGSSLIEELFGRPSADCLRPSHLPD